MDKHVSHVCKRTSNVDTTHRNRGHFLKGRSLKKEMGLKWLLLYQPVSDWLSIDLYSLKQRELIRRVRMMYVDINQNQGK